MKILYLGQRGIPALEPDLPINGRERRVQAVAEEMAERGYKVAVTCGFPFVSKNIRNFNGVKLVHKFSLDPEKAGGWVYSVSSLFTIIGQKPGVVHIHGWRMAALAKVIKMISPRSVLVWTVDRIPDINVSWLRLVARSAEEACDAVTAPNRRVQYLMLHYCGVKARYVADGYTEKNYLKEISLRHYGVRKGQYLLCWASQPKEVGFVAKAYAESGSKKKLVVMSEQKGYMVRLAKKYDFLRFAGEATGRPAESLIRGAAAVVIGGGAGPSAILKTMENRKPVVAVVDPLYEEMLGISAQFVKSGDVKSLSRILKVLAKSNKEQKDWGQKAQKRARKYFQWPDLVDQYMRLYRYPLARAVAVDSAIRPKFVTR